MKLPVISLYRPWAGLIRLQLKTIETRLHDRYKNLEGKTIAIHAGKKMDKEMYDMVIAHSKFDTPPRVAEAIKETIELEGIICTVQVHKVGWLDESHSREACIDCKDTKRFGLFLKNVQPIKPIIVKGSQGIWSYEFDYKQLQPDE